MSTTTLKVNIGLTFTDGTTKTVGMDNVLESEMPNISDRVKAINANMSDAFKSTFTTETGAQVAAIGKAQTVITEEEVVYSVG